MFGICHSITCARSGISRVDAADLPEVVRVTEELIFRLDAVRILPTLLHYRFLEVHDLSVLLELAPLDASLLHYVGRYCTADQIEDARQTILAGGNAALLKRSF
jgi:hypothetical protein